jgi:hypothetical protein
VTRITVFAFLVRNAERRSREGQYRMDWSRLVWESSGWTWVGATIAALIGPIVLIAVRHEIRIRRIRLIDALERPFRGEQKRGDPKFSAFGPSIEYVKAKYAVDLDPPLNPPDLNAFREMDLQKPEVERFLRNLRWWQIRSNWTLLLAALPFVAIAAAGFHLVFVLGVAVLFPGECPQLDRGCGAVVPAAPDATRVLLVLTAAFLGAYAFALRILIRAVVVFDLSAITMFRAAMHIALNVPVACLLYAALSDAADLLPGGGAVVGIGVWMLLAFAFGLVPDAGMQFAFLRVARILPFIKGMDGRFVPLAPSVPLDLIDGIDFFTRFRLEEANVHEVQNLACANPLMLFVETPFGLYQVIDWVAQAQLCTQVGLERFLLLRQQNIRTVFDLERAVLSESSEPTVQRVVGAILFASTDQKRRIAETAGATFASFGLSGQSTLTLAEFDAAVMQAMIDKEGWNEALEHFVRVILDDLHVSRLRSIWNAVETVIGAPGWALRDTRRPRATDPS